MRSRAAATDCRRIGMVRRDWAVAVFAVGRAKVGGVRMALKLRILYRGPLSSCNYDCRYCPFAKRHETAAELGRDRGALQRFVAWLSQQFDVRFSILFTPWGEALTRP